MRLNKFIAAGSPLSRRKADSAIAAGRVLVNDQPPEQGMDVTDTDIVTLDGKRITPAVNTVTIMFNKPTGYIVSRDGQGSPTIYDLLPPEYRQLNPVGRLDKDSSGLLLVTNDGQLANQLTHPSKQKEKVYQLTLYKPLTEADRQKIERGIELEDGLSQLTVTPQSVIPTEVEGSGTTSKRDSSTPPNVSPRVEPGASARNDTSPIYEVSMQEGRNRQIRRTFAALNYEVKTLHRTQFGDYKLEDLKSGQYKIS